MTAASPGGPRYNSALTAAQRAASVNGIWLCQNCAKLIDNDPVRFTVDALRAWKARAEAHALTLIGRTNSQSPPDEEISYEQEISRMSARFSYLFRRLSIYEPVGMMRHLDLTSVNLLRYTAELNREIAAGRLRDQRLSMPDNGTESFTFACFMALVRGFMLDRFITQGRMTLDAMPELPEWKDLVTRWHEGVLSEQKWFRDWSDQMSRDLVDAQWVELGRHFLEQDDDRTMPVLQEIAKVSILLGMIARRFLLLGAVPV